MDHNVIAAERAIQIEEASHEAACYGTAIENGHTQEAAENCDDGSVGCPNCPFKHQS